MAASSVVTHPPSRVARWDLRPGSRLSRGLRSALRPSAAAAGRGESAGGIEDWEGGREGRGVPREGCRGRRVRRRRGVEMLGAKAVLASGGGTDFGGGGAC